jgi:cell division protease FtsH
MNADAIRQWLLRRRRAASVKRKPAGRRTALALLASLAALLAVFAWCLSYLSPSAEGRQLTLDQLGDLARSGRVVEATFRDEDSRIVGRYRAAVAVTVTPPAQPPAEGEQPATTLAPRPSTEPRGAGEFWTSYPSSGSVTARLIEQLEGAGAEVDIDDQPGKQKVRMVTTFLLPLMILANLFALLFSAARGGSSAIGDVMTFGSIGQKRLRRGESAPVTFRDVAGADEAVAELREVVDYLTDPARYEQLGAMPPKGVLLFGPPGCGKTLLAKAVAGEAGVPFFSVTGAEFVESLVGVGAARVRDLFARVRAVAPAIVFIDELDAAGRRRGVGGGTGGSDEREQTLNQLLVEMDGFAVSSGIVVVAATNRPDIIDPALMRPGRFDRHITVDPPDGQGRSLILALHAAKKPLGPDVDLATLARRTPGFTGADLANVVNEAALLAVRGGSRVVHQTHLEEAVDRVLHGPQRRGRVLTADDRLRLATHEAGHAVVAAATGRAEDIHRVSILTRGRGLATTTLSSDADHAVVTQSMLLARLTTTLGGLAAEELMLGEPSTGAEDDLEQATELARNIAGRWGMSLELGRARLLASDAELYLGDASALGWLSTETHETLDREVRRLLDEAEADALRLLRVHRAALNGLVERLLAEETIEGEDLTDALARVQHSQNGRNAKARARTRARQAR